MCTTLVLFMCTTLVLFMCTTNSHLGVAESGYKQTNKQQMLQLALHEGHVYCLWPLPHLLLVCTTVVCVLFVDTLTSTISVYCLWTLPRLLLVCTVCGHSHVYYYCVLLWYVYCLWPLSSRSNIGQLGCWVAASSSHRKQLQIHKLIFWLLSYIVGYSRIY